MLRLAISEIPGDLFIINEEELEREKPSYTWETLQLLRKKYNSDESIVFIIGQDSLLTLPKWYRGLELLDFCHLLVCTRPGYQLTKAIAKNYDWLYTRLVYNFDAMYYKSAGLIYHANTPGISVSSSEIRKKYRSGLSCGILTPTSVQKYIKKWGLYR